jgi:hypothetical protein
MDPLEIQSESSEYVGALRPLRVAKAVAWLLVWAVLAAQVVCFVLAQFTGSLGAPGGAVAAATPAAQTRPASNPATSEANAPALAPRPQAPAMLLAVGEAEAVRLRRAAVESVLSLTEFVGPVAALALMMLIGTALQIVLVGRLGGARGFASSLVWSIVLLLTLTPWQQFLGGMAASGVLFDYDTLQTALRQVQPQWSAGEYASPVFLAHLARFLLAPFIVLLVWILVGLRFAQGMRQVNRSTSVPAPAAEP